MFDLALRLHKTAGEIGRMPSRELSEWIAYLNILSEERTRADMDATAARLAEDARQKTIQKRKGK